MARGSRSEIRRARAPHRRQAWFALAAAVLAPALAAGTALAEVSDHLLVHGLQDLEFHETDDGSRLLSRNGGEPGGAGQLRLWVATAPLAGLQGVAVGRFVGGEASEEGESDASLEQAFLRFTVPGGARVSIDAGKILAPFGDFSRRYTSDKNPLIGAPDAYGVDYPLGVAVSGRAHMFDYSVALIDQPLVNESYVPEYDQALRPGLGVGLTPMIGLRIGAYGTSGPYLGADVAPMLPAGAAWRDFDQEVVGLELELCRGYFEFHGELAFSSYEVPATAGVARGQAWFVEPKYTWTPRFFTALRLQRNDYPFIMPVSSNFWISANAAFLDAELGAGWRFTPDLVLKGAVRRDHWSVEPDRRWMFPDGASFALQLSYAFDVLGWVDRPR